MIGYVTLGTNDLARAARYYDELFALIGAERVFQGDNFVAWGNSPTAPAISVITPFDGKPATAGNGTMVAISVETPEQVNAFHAKALELGSIDEGAPGPRIENFYAAYFRDLDGNKLNAFCMVGDDS
jgi:catechol 2,3-dioxygenase-like lactoylglutathione lyase family enzyme